MTEIPSGPLEREPAGPFIGQQERVALLDQALDGVICGAYDRRIIEWLVGWDASTVRTIASLIMRARRAEAAQVAADLAGLRRPGGDPHVLVTRPHDWPPDRK
jgi:hypothetical protein